MTTATIKEAAEKLGVSLDDMVHYQARGNRAIIEIDLKMPAPDNADHLKSPQPPGTLTPEEEFRRKYPDINVETEFFKLVSSMTVPEGVSDKDLLIDALEAKYGK